MRDLASIPRVEAVATANAQAAPGSSRPTYLFQHAGSLRAQARLSVSRSGAPACLRLGTRDAIADDADWAVAGAHAGGSCNRWPVSRTFVLAGRDIRPFAGPGARAER